MFRRPWFARVLFCIAALTQLSAPFAVGGRSASLAMDAAHCQLMQSARNEAARTNDAGPAAAAVHVAATVQNERTPEPDRPCHDHSCCSPCHGAAVLHPFDAGCVAPHVASFLCEHFVDAAGVVFSPLNKGAAARAPPQIV